MAEFLKPDYIVEYEQKLLRQKWVVSKGSHGLPQVWTKDREVCITDRVFNHTEDAIAAVPDMLLALEEARNCLLNGGEPALSHGLRTIDAVLDQVRGCIKR